MRACFPKIGLLYNPAFLGLKDVGLSPLLCSHITHHVCECTPLDGYAAAARRIHAATTKIASLTCLSGLNATSELGAVEYARSARGYSRHVSDTCLHMLGAVSYRAGQSSPSPLRLHDKHKIHPSTCSDAAISLPHASCTLRMTHTQHRGRQVKRMVPRGEMPHICSFDVAQTPQGCAGW